MDPSSSVQDEKKSSEDEVYSYNEGDVVSPSSAGSQELHRKLRGRQVQLFAVGGAIGTCKWIHQIPALTTVLHN
jgi:amino acid transporter